MKYSPFADYLGWLMAFFVIVSVMAVTHNGGSPMQPNKISGIAYHLSPASGRKGCA
jgi:cytochrome b561